MVIAIPSLMDRYLPSVAGGWAWLLEQPWMSVVLAVVVLISMRRHSVLSFGSHHLSIWVFLSFLIYLSSLLASGYSPLNLALISALLLLALSDLIITSITRPRTPFFTYNIGALQGLLFLIHPAYIILYPYYIINLKSIGNSSTRHISGLIMGTVSVILIATMLCAVPTIEGIQSYWLGLVRDLSSISSMSTTHLPPLIIDLLYLSVITIATIQVYRSSVTRVRFSLKYHLRLAWILMIPHLIFNLYGGVGPLFLMGSLFSSSVIADYLVAHSSARWLSLFLLLFSVLSLFFRYWGEVPLAFNI